jgi:hypothetical protein
VRTTVAVWWPVLRSECVADRLDRRCRTTGSKGFAQARRAQRATHRGLRLQPQSGGDRRRLHAQPLEDGLARAPGARGRPWV